MTTHSSKSDDRTASTPAEVSRRTVLGASAFAVPAIVAVTATPAFAVSGVVETVSVVLGQNTVAPGGSTSVTVTLKDSTGATVAGRLVSLSSSSTSVTLANTTGTSDASGVMTTTATVASGATTGTAVITATSDGKNGSASLTYQTPGTVTATSTYSGVPYGTALSADGSLLYIAGTTTSVVSNMFGGTTTVSKKAVSVVNASTLAVVRTVAFDSFGNAPTIVRLFSDGSKAWVTSPTDYGEIDIATSTMTDHGTANGPMNDMFLAAGDSGSYALGGTSNSMMGVMLYSFATGNKTMAHKANLGSLERIARSVDGTRIYFARSAAFIYQGMLGYIDIASRDAYTVLSGGTTSAKAAMAMAPDGATLYLAGLTSNAKDIAAFDLATNKIAWKVTPTSTAPVDMQVSADGSFLYMVDPSGNLRVLDIASRTVSTVVSAPFAGTASYPCLTLSPNGKNAYVSLQATSNTATTSRVFAVAL